MNDSAKALLICALFVILFTVIVPESWALVGDYVFHYDKSAGNYDEGNIRFETYAYLFHTLAAPFTYNTHAYYYFILFMLAFVTPMLLYYISRHWLSVLLYFCCTNYFYFMLGQAGQMLAGIFLLLLFAVRNNYLRAGIVLISSLAHSQAFIVSLVAFAALLLFEKYRAGMFPGCTAIVHWSRPDEVIDVPLFGGKESAGLMVGNLFTFFTRIIGFPFLIMGIAGHVKAKNYAPLAVSVFAITASFFVSPRTLYLIPLMLIPGITSYYLSKQRSKKWRVLFFLLILLWGVYEFLFWVDYRMWC